MKKIFNIFIIVILFIKFCEIKQSYAQQVQLEWVANYGIQYNGWPVSVTIDRLGNSYVCGSVSNSSLWYQVATIKYNNSGIQQWVKINGDSTEQENFPVSINLDTAGNLYVAGYSGNLNIPYYYGFLTKYNNNGSYSWTRKFYGNTNIFKYINMAIDKRGFIYVTGNTSPVPNQIFIIKYNSSGDSIWTRNYSAGGYNGPSSVSLTLDTLFNVYIGGTISTYPARFLYLVIKYDSNGNFLWDQIYGNPMWRQQLRKIAVDNSSNVYTTGTLQPYNSGNNSTFLTLKYNSYGVQQWVKSIYSQYNDEACALTLDYSNNVIVTGYRLVGPNTNYIYKTIKYNTNGDSIWENLYIDTSTNGHYDQSYSILSDSSNNVYISGQTPNNITTIKYSNSGVQQWLMNYSGSAAWGGLAIDNARNLLVLGSDNLGYLLIKYSQFLGVNPISNTIPKNFTLSNKPNPFNPQTKICFSLPFEAKVDIHIYDILGRRIEKIFDKDIKAGDYEINWNGKNFSSGIYFCKLNALFKNDNLNSISRTIKLVLNK